MLTHYTKKQMELNNWINELGFQTEMEKVFGKYCVDIYIPELKWVVELDGFGHWSKKDAKRDEYLVNEFCIDNIIHIKYKEAIKNTVQKIILTAVESKYGKG